MPASDVALLMAAKLLCATARGAASKASKPSAAKLVLLSIDAKRVLCVRCVRRGVSTRLEDDEEDVLLRDAMRAR